VAALVLIVAVPLGAATPRVSYETARDREQAVRARLDTGSPSKAAIGEAHRVIAAYMRLAARYPASAYTDNALAQAAALSADLWGLTGDDADRARAVRLYKRVVTGFPSSSVVPVARKELKRLDTDSAPASSTPGSSQAARPAASTPVAANRPPKPAATSGTQAAGAADADERIIPVPETAKLKARDVAPASAAPTAPSPGTGAIVSVTRTTLNDLVRVIIELDREVPYHEERITNPDRVFIDLRGIKPAKGLKRTMKFDEGVVRQVRIGQPTEDVTRVVLEVDGTASHSLFALYNPYRLVVDCERPGSGSSVTPPPLARLTSAPLARTISTVSVPPPTPINTRLLAAARAPRARSTQAAKTPARPPLTAKVTAPDLSQPAAPPSTSVAAATRRTKDASKPDPSQPAASGPAAATLQGRFSLSRQLGLGISRIVIDAGHGGHDPGAQVKGLDESELVLDVALRLEQLLLAQPGVEVVMTRRTDVFIPLEERTAIANREGADLFLSIHANASRSGKARGIETYFLNFASNREAEAVAARENATSERTMHSLPDIVKAITLSDKVDESRDFATMVQRSMVERLRVKNRTLRDLGVKQAPFVVLIGAVMPSVLAEISFVTNPQECKLLKTPAYRQHIAEALFDGIAQYQRSLKTLSTAANQ
jgi:N-acetylmuramoyl-L-alanine amidase